MDGHFPGPAQVLQMLSAPLRWIDERVSYRSREIARDAARLTKAKAELNRFIRKELERPLIRSA